MSGANQVHRLVVEILRLKTSGLEIIPSLERESKALFRNKFFRRADYPLLAHPSTREASRPLIAPPTALVRKLLSDQRRLSLNRCHPKILTQLLIFIET